MWSRYETEAGSEQGIHLRLLRREPPVPEEAFELPDVDLPRGGVRDLGLPRANDECAWMPYRSDEELSQRPIDGRFVLAKVAEYYNLSLRRIVGTGRSKWVIQPRQVAMWICRNILTMSFPEVGKLFERDHSTVMQACDRISALLRSNRDFADELDRVVRFIDPRHRILESTWQGRTMNIPRLPWDEYWMLMAHLTATRSTCDRGPELLFDLGRHGVGAVLVKNKRMIAGGYNGSAPGQPHCDEYRGGHLMQEGHCIRTIHSEMNAIIQCALDGISPQGATLYTTASPCFDCTKVIIRAGIIRVVFGQEYDSRYGLSGGVSDILLRSGVDMQKLVITREALEGTPPFSSVSSARIISSRPSWYFPSQ